MRAETTWKPKWMRWAVGGGVALAVTVVVWFAVANSLPLDQGAIRDKLSAGGFAFEPDESAAFRGENLIGDVWGAPSDGVTYYFRLHVSGHGARYDTISCAVFLMPERKRAHNQRPILYLTHNRGVGTRIEQQWAGVKLDSPEPPVIRDGAMVQFEKVVNALR